jgi:hypothetical protein
VHVTVHDGDGNPHIIRNEDGLLLGWDLGVKGELNHAQLSIQAWRGCFPVEVWLHGVWLREAFHALEGGLVELQLETESFGD